MNRPGQANRAPLLLLGGLLLIVGGAVAVCKFWPAPSGHAAATASADPVEPVKPGETLQVPFILWGGDVATFVANGGLETAKDSIFARQGLNIKLTPGDDFDAQVKDYLDNKSPFLRGTLSMLGQASDKLTAKPETTPVVFLQLTWSAGDHLVGRAAFASLNDLKGKKIALQKGGPHVGMLNDCLRTAQLDWKDITVVWTDDVSGPKGPAEAFRKDGTIDGCFAISPEMSDLTGGLKSVGDGTAKTLKGAHVVVSTTWMSHSIADVYACRSDFFDKNKDLVQKFAAGYLKGVEELTAMRDNHNTKTPDKDKEGQYVRWLKLSQDTWGKDQLPTLDDAHGLISDATFAGLPGNIAFFTSKGNLTGFAFKAAQAEAIPEDPATQPLKVNPAPFRQADLDYDALRKLGDLNGKPIPGRINAEVKADDKPIYSFTIPFKPNDAAFPEKDFGKDFQRTLEEASLFGNAVVEIKGHSQPAALIRHFLDAAKDKGVLKFDAVPGAYSFAADGKPLDLNSMKAILDAIDKNSDLRFADSGGTTHAISEEVQYLQTLSEDRAKAARTALVTFGQSKGIVLDQGQIRSQGVGVREPLHANPANEEESGKNRRGVISILPTDRLQLDEFVP